jgi:hypothetical protein
MRKASAKKKAEFAKNLITPALIDAVRDMRDGDLRHVYLVSVSVAVRLVRLGWVDVAADKDNYDDIFIRLNEVGLAKAAEFDAEAIESPIE